MKNPPLKKLRRLREKKRLSTKNVANLVDISETMYVYIENGKRRLSYDMAYKLSNIFDLTPDELFYEDIYEFYQNTLI